MAKIHIGADCWRADDGTIYQSDGEGYIEVSEDHAAELAGEESAKPVVDYTSFLKDELVEMCRERGLKVSGNRDDLIARLVGDDG